MRFCVTQAKPFHHLHMCHRTHPIFIHQYMFVAYSMRLTERISQSTGGCIVSNIISKCLLRNITYDCCSTYEQCCYDSLCNFWESHFIFIQSSAIFHIRKLSEPFWITLDIQIFKYQHIRKWLVENKAFYNLYVI